MDIELTKLDEVTELKFSGELTILNINEIKEKMVESLSAETSILLNHEEVTEVDLTYIQLLKSFCYTAEKKQLSVSISDNSAESLQKVIAATGIHNFVFNDSKEE